MFLVMLTILEEGFPESVWRHLLISFKKSHSTAFSLPLVKVFGHLWRSEGKKTLGGGLFSVRFFILNFRKVIN